MYSPVSSASEPMSVLSPPLIEPGATMVSGPRSPRRGPGSISETSACVSASAYAVETASAPMATRLPRASRTPCETFMEPPYGPLPRPRGLQAARCMPTTVVQCESSSCQLQTQRTRGRLYVSSTQQALMAPAEPGRLRCGAHQDPVLV